MSDPRFEDRRLGSPYDSTDWLRRYADSAGDGSGWILAAVVAAVLVVGLLAFGMNGGGPTTATGPMSPPETTGMAPRSTPTPTPALPPAPPAR